jgi:leader peptidase (prepilin peptidase)/N-methyltransferase
VRPYDNVPVISWLLLRGRCRDCSEPISARYPVVEAGTGVLWLAVAAVHGDDTPSSCSGSSW